MSASMRPISPPQPSSPSVTATTVSSSSPPTTSRSTVFPSGISRGGGGPSTTAPSSVSSSHLPPPPHPVPGPGATPGTQAHVHPHPQPHPQPPPTHAIHPAQNRPHAAGPPPAPPSSSSAAARAPPPASPTNPSHLPSEAEQEQVAQARTALVASIGNTLDHELQTRASLLHSNQAAIERQERDVERALADLRREDDRMLKVLNQGSRQVKELGDVQNWAERLERDFLVLEETMRLVRRGSRSGSESGSSWSGSGSGSGSWSGSDRGSVAGDEDGDGDVTMADGDSVLGPTGQDAVNMDKGKQSIEPSSTTAMDVSSSRDALPPRNVESEPSMLVDLVSSSNGANTAPQQSPTSTGWLRKLWWRS
ncbi:hypothetical protein Daus18300_000029 [Diaporthe australafricana]|uniref:Biogenesis of lysosome-related organelles complex 1 subunit 1 n=1 Tax=Diaporthe australafricana TaxID=127596 RepID=A0ABR3Y6J6_9PEZI